MKAVLAFDSLKGSLTAREACRAAADALRSVKPAWDVEEKPMADGGEGTAAALLAARGGEWVGVRVTGPLPGLDVDAGYAWFPDDGEALVEMAAASGLTLLRPADRDPLRTTTFGTGQLLCSVFGRGAKSVLLAVGGSATVDGGVGAAMALGWRFLDSAGRSVGLGGGEVARIHAIERPAGGNWPPVRVLCDVDNPLCGEHGAARVYGPQKGATPETAGRLDAALAHLADVVRRELGLDIRAVPRAGAAGGLAAGAIAFMNAALTSGVDELMLAAGLERAMAGADWVLTGEGSFDAQSCRGKVVSGVARLARRAGARVCVLAGEIRAPESAWRDLGIDAALALRAPGMSLEESMSRGAELLGRRVREWAGKLRSYV